MEGNRADLLHASLREVEGINLDTKSDLFAAAKEGKVEFVQDLLRDGADINITDKDGQTALFAAVEGGNPKVVQVLLSHGADVGITDHKRETALFAIAKTIQRLSIGCRGAQGVSKRSAIHVIIEIVKLLLSHGASLDASNIEGETPLLFSLSYMCFRMPHVNLDEVDILTEVCQFLVGRKADINARTHSGHTAIHLVLLLLRDVLNQEMVQNTEVQFSLKLQSAKYLVHLLCFILSCPWCSKSLAASRDNDNGNTPLHLWGALPNPCELDELDEGNNDPSLSDTEFHFESILSDMATYLFTRGAKVNASNGNGETPLHMAQTWSAAKLLLAKGALPNCTDIHGNTPLLSCVEREMLRQQGKHSLLLENRCKFVYDSMEAKASIRWQEILDSGMDLFKANEKGTTVLSLLLQGYSLHIIEAFFEATGAHAPDNQIQYSKHYDSNGDFPLHVICRDSGSELWKLSLIHHLIQSARCNVHSVNRRGETALHTICQRKKIDFISCEMIKSLRSYGARVDAQDGGGKTCYDLAVNKPELMALLKEDIKLVDMHALLPWSSKSQEHKASLSQVVQGQNAQKTGSFHFHIEPIGSGAFGHVYAGIDERDGREVAVKRFEKLRMCRPEDQREIKHLLQVADSGHVVQYLTHEKDQHFVYIVMELMEGNLKTLLDAQVKKEELVPLCQDVVNGLSFLHENNIIHRDIKPGNILFKRNPKLHLKLADFGLSGYVSADGSASQTTTVMHSNAGTRCWMAPQLLSGTEEHSTASDMFACGLLLHYILSGQKHPFGPEDQVNKGHIVVQHETVANILNNKLMVNAGVPPEAKDLVMSMVSCNKDDRPSAAESLRHPLFWGSSKKVRFLCAVANRPQFVRPRHLAHRALSLVEQDLENALGPQFNKNSWDRNIPHLYAEMIKSKFSRRYVTSSAVDLVRFVRNSSAHSSELTPAMQKSVLEDFVFLTKFPTLLMNVFKAVHTHSWNKLLEIKYVIDED